MACFEDVSEFPVRLCDQGTAPDQAWTQYTNQTKRMAEGYNTQNNVHSILPDQLRPLPGMNQFNGLISNTQIKFPHLGDFFLQKLVYSN